MHLRISIFKLVTTCILISGCISPKSFTDPQVPPISFDAVERQAEPLRLRHFVEFQRNGASYPAAHATLNAIVERTLRGSSVILPAEDGLDGEIRVTVNNIGDLGDAAARGFGTGLTFGVVGSTVVDGYEMSALLNARGRTASRSGVRHSIYTAIGNTSLPPGAELTTLDLAFQKVVESMLLRVLRDMQQRGDLPGTATSVSSSAAVN